MQKRINGIPVYAPLGRNQNTLKGVQNQTGKQRVRNFTSPILQIFGSIINNIQKCCKRYIDIGTTLKFFKSVSFNVMQPQIDTGNGMLSQFLAGHMRIGEWFIGIAFACHHCAYIKHQLVIFTPETHGIGSVLIHPVTIVYQHIPGTGCKVVTDGIIFQVTKISAKQKI